MLVTGPRVPGQIVLQVLVAAASLTLPAIASAKDVVFKRHVINADTDYSAAAVIDVNHDGKLDIVCGGDWYEAPNWTRHFVRDVPRIRDRPDGFSHLTLDINRDGWDDVVTVNYRSSSIKWIQHPGQDLGPWTTHVVVEPGPMETGRLVDIDGDGQVDLLPNGARFAAWYEMIWKTGSTSGEPEWIRHDLPAEAGGHGLGFGDVDGDGRGDIVGQFGWLQAPEDRRTDRWLWHPEYHLERASIPMIVADADDDGDNDIIWTSAHGFGIYWLEQTTSPDQGRTWTRHAIDTSWSQGHAPLWVDFDGDGRNEFVAGKRYMSHGGADPGAYNPLVIYRYQFSPESRSWQRWTVSAGNRVGAGLDPKAADMDGDGDLDLVASGRSGLYLLENLGASGAEREPNPTPPYDDHHEVLTVKDGSDSSQMVETAEDWGRRRAHIVASIEKALGQLPESVNRVPLDVKTEAEHSSEGSTERTISYQVNAARRVRAHLLVPRSATIGTTPGVLCLFENAAVSRRVATELAQRGYVCLSPEPTSQLETMDMVWDAMRGIDLLQSLLEVHGERLAVLGDASAGRVPAVLAAVDQRVIATMSDSRMLIDEAVLGFSSSELLASIAPRSIWIQPSGAGPGAALLDAVSQASAIFELRRVANNLHVADPTTEDVIRWSDQGGVYEWLDARLKRQRRFGRRRPAS